MRTPKESIESAQDSLHAHPGGLVLALAIVVVSLVALNFSLKWSIQHAGVWQESVATLMYGAWASQAIVFGAWVAIGSGTLVARFAITIPCLLLLYVTPQMFRSHHHFLDRISFMTIAIAALLLFTGSIAFFSAVRKFFGVQIGLSGTSSGDQAKFRYSTRALLATVALYALTCALVGQSDLRPHQSFLSTEVVISPSVYFATTGIRSIIVAVVLLPTLAIPVFMLKSRVSFQSIGIAVALWVLITILASAAFLYAESLPPARVLYFIILLQLGSTLSGIVATLPLRWCGYRLRNNSPAIV